MIPREQGGGKGGSTDATLWSLTKTIQEALAKGLKATIMGLDMTAAFDRVNRRKLLVKLLELGAPAWIINFVRSFLSHRKTTLVHPGYQSEPFWVNCGVPQGSPLSPIFFLIFAAPILKIAKNRKLNIARSVATCNIYAYVDDTYFLIVSDSHKTNCLAIEILHAELMEWAKDNEVAFGAEK